jgi:hypothetical protein
MFNGFIGFGFGGSHLDVTRLTYELETLGDTSISLVQIDKTLSTSSVALTYATTVLSVTNLTATEAATSLSISTASVTPTITWKSLIGAPSLFKEINIQMHSREDRT